MAIEDASLPPASWHFGVAVVASCFFEGLVRLSCRRTAARRGCAFRIEILNLKMKNQDSSQGKNHGTLLSSGGRYKAVHVSFSTFPLEAVDETASWLLGCTCQLLSCIFSLGRYLGRHE